MNFTILHVGEPKEGYLRDAFSEYQKRMSVLGGLETVTVKAAKTFGKDPTEAEIAQLLEREGEEFSRLLSQPRYAKAYKVALCIEGKELSSVAFSDLIGRVSLSGRGQMVFLIGGSWGLSPKIKAMADFSLSFSPMTFPHSLFRVMLAEQIYRAVSIEKGSSYHK